MHIIFDDITLVLIGRTLDTNLFCRLNSLLAQPRITDLGSIQMIGDNAFRRRCSATCMFVVESESAHKFVRGRCTLVALNIGVVSRLDEYPTLAHLPLTGPLLKSGSACTHI